MTVSDLRVVVDALRDVPGVADAAMAPDPGGIGMLRLALSPGVDEVEVAAKVGQMLREQFGLGVDAERIQLVEDMDAGHDAALDAPEDASSGHAGHLHTRMAIRRMHIVSSGLQVSAEITLSQGSVAATGRADGTATQSGVQRAVAHATLHAVEELLGETVRFELEAIEATATGQVRTVLVTVTMLTGAGSERLTGVAGIRDDVRQATIRATLDAVNRRVEMLAG